MNAGEYTTELTDSDLLRIPADVAAQLPKAARARILVLTDEQAGDAEWRLGTYAHFLREDSPEDAVYDPLR